MSLAACASKLPVIIGMVSADHTEVGERVLQGRQTMALPPGATSLVGAIVPYARALTLRMSPLYEYGKGF